MQKMQVESVADLVRAAENLRTSPDGRPLRAREEHLPDTCLTRAFA
jgi:hypothetical protein